MSAIAGSKDEAEVIKHYREYPEWVTYEGVLEVGEVANLHQLGRAENRPDKGQFLHLDASSLAEGAGADEALRRGFRAAGLADDADDS